MKIVIIDKNDSRRDSLFNKINKNYKDLIDFKQKSDGPTLVEKSYDLIIIHKGNSESDEILMNTNLENITKVVFSGGDKNNRKVFDYEYYLNDKYLISGINEIINEFQNSGKIPLDLTKDINDIDDYVSQHEESNFWGAYRLLRFIAHLYPGASLNEKLEKTKLKLSSLSVEFDDNVGKEQQLRVNDINGKLKIIGKNYSELLENRNIRVAVVDDRIEDGWGDAYEALFNLGKFTNEVIMIKSMQEALSLDTSELDLIVLDLRIEELATGEENDILNIDDISGIRLIKKLKKKDKTLPIILATASNKVWGYEAAFDSGVTACWTKESPRFGVSNNLLVSNSVALIKIVSNVLLWSLKTRPLLKGLDKLIDKMYDDHPGAAHEVETKGKHVYAQLQQKHGDFVQNTFGNSHLDISFLALWSIGNVLRDVFCKKRSEDGKTKYEVDIDGEKCLFCTESENNEGKKIFTLERNKYNNKFDMESKNFPDNIFIEFLLAARSLNDEWSTFSKIRFKRNQLKYIHGGVLKEDLEEISDLKHHYDILGIFYKLIFEEDNFPYQSKLNSIIK